MTEKKDKRYLSDNAQLMAEWNYEKNIDLDPSKLTLGSGKKVWWKCSKGHEWQAEIKSRNNGSQCPYCSGRYVIKGVNDLQTLNPTLSKEWNYNKNGELTPMDVMPNSHNKVWWKCSKGHEWQAVVGDRNIGKGCPFCSGRYAIKNENDLLSVNPILAKEWNYEKNNGLTPLDVLPNSNKKVWWKCSKGHEWQATIANRNKGRGCVICDSERKTSFPEYAIEYYLKSSGLEIIHSYKEKGYEIDIYIPSKKIGIEYDGHFWHQNKAEKDLEKNKKCQKDGIKLYRIREGLPSLSAGSIDYIVQENQKDLPQTLETILSEIVGTRVDVDFERDGIEIENLREYTEKKNSLLFSNSSLAKEWNYEKNGNLRPESFAANSGKKVWWKCQKGHEWQATINHRNNDYNCPYCTGRYTIKGTTDLLTINPNLAIEWNYEKNNDLKPYHFSAKSHKKVWWKCSKGHEWQAVIASRNSGRGCPYCKGQKVLAGYNDLATVNPVLSQEWNYEKNKDLKPEHFTANSGEKIWWKCQKGHEWQATINHRNNGRGCPECYKNRRKKQ